jgi:hypothetical protein
MSLSPVQSQALAQLVAGKRIVEVAAALKINERTIRRWKQEPEFAKELRDEVECSQGFAVMQAAEVERVTAESSRESMKFLMATMKNPDNDAMFRIRSAVEIQKVALQSSRMSDARRWRAFVYEDRKRQRESAPRSPGVSPGQRKSDPTINAEHAVCEKPVETEQALHSSSVLTSETETAALVAAAQPLEKPDKSGHVTAPHPASDAALPCASTQSPPLENEEQGGSSAQPSDPIPPEAAHAAATPLEKPDKTGHSAATQNQKKWPGRPNKVPFYANVCARR